MEPNNVHGTAISETSDLLEVWQKEQIKLLRAKYGLSDRDATLIVVSCIIARGEVYDALLTIGGSNHELVA